MRWIEELLMGLTTLSHLTATHRRHCHHSRLEEGAEESDSFVGWLYWVDKIGWMVERG